MKAKHLRHTLPLLFLCLGGSAQAATNLFSNGGFEDNAGTTRTGFAGVSNFRPIPQYGEIATTWEAGTPTGYQAALIDGVGVNNPEGDYFVSLHNNGACIVNSFDSGDALYGLDSPLTVGTTYKLSFQVASYSSRLLNTGTAATNGNFVAVSDDTQIATTWTIDIFDGSYGLIQNQTGNLAASSGNWSTHDWQQINYEFTYSADMVYLGISNIGGFGSAMLIDNMSLTAVPEPSAAILGLFGLLATFRRRR
jgi:hypothetical protein